MADDLIFHHYPNSPFSEKVRVAFGLKQLAWKSVEVPNIMPKPDLMPLTGGYRKTPVLQVGADIYCDTQLIMLEIERRTPEPHLLPVGQEGEARALAMWIDRNIFWAAVGVVMGAIGDKLPEAFQKDRSDFSGRSFDPAKLKAAQPFAREQTYAHLQIAEEMLRDGRPFLLGAVASLADCALYNPVWFLQVRMGQGDAPSPLDRLPKLVEWSKKMKALGNGKPTPMTGAEALDVAKAATPAATKVDDKDPSGLKAGQKISVTPDDTGKVPVTGELVGLSADRISIKRTDERVGDVVVHFPRAGFVTAAA
ncbi:MAG: glutathione S-transferase family protein [Proteobacteria bacterium]|nr:glutathione S-transferase family protein [Pseudomonadota bacterium]